MPQPAYEAALLRVALHEPQGEGYEWVWMPRTVSVFTDPRPQYMLLL